jgi:hypothetical protein
MVFWCSAIHAEQLSAPGYTGAINTPTAAVMAPGSLGMALTNSTPEKARQFTGLGYFGGINQGFGLFPGFEAVGRLTYDGFIRCNAYEGTAVCPSATRDLSMSAKYQLPMDAYLPKIYDFGLKLAVGANDFGGAAANYKQAYGVATADNGRVSASLGWAKSPPDQGLMHGVFGSVSARVSDQFSLILENDTREFRTGLSYNTRLSSNVDLTFAASKKLTHRSTELPYQMTAGFTYYFGRAISEEARKPRALAEFMPAPVTLPAPVLPSTPLPLAFSTKPPSSAQTISTPSSAEARPVAPLVAPGNTYSGLVGNLLKDAFDKSLAPPAPLAESALSPLEQDQAEAIAQKFQEMGFSDINVGVIPQGWYVKAEPRLWRQDRMDAFGAALAAFALSPIGEDRQLGLRLTFMGQEVAGLTSNMGCMRHYLQGEDVCESNKALEFYFDAEEIPGQRQVQWLVSQHHDGRFKPRIELSPAASYVVGTEYGLWDYSLGMTYGWEVPLAKGLFWQGYNSKLLVQTANFEDKNNYFRRVGLGENTRTGANLMVYQTQLMPRAWVQLAAGELGYRTQGNQINAAWASREGDLRATWVAGRWKDQVGQHELKPNLLNLGWRPFQNNFQLTFTKGQFLNNDKGHRIGAAFSYGENSLQFYWRKTGPSDILPNRNDFIGFTVSMPLGPAKSYELGPLALRGRDRWDLGLETKVRQPDNYIEPGYGLFPGIRHSLDTDVFDYNRADNGILRIYGHKIRVVARDLLQKRKMQETATTLVR